MCMCVGIAHAAPRLHSRSATPALLQPMAASMSSMRRAAVGGRARCVSVRAATALPKQFKAVKPVGDRVLVKVDKQEMKSIGGVLLPANAAKKPTAGAIVGMGDVSLVKMGDRVIYSKYAGTEVEVAGEEHVLLKEDDVIGVLTASEKISELKPLGDRILIKMAEAEEKSSGGVLLTSQSAEKPNFGTVVSVGAGRKKEDGEVSAPNVAVGSTVMYSKYSGTEFEEEDLGYIIISEGDVLAALS
uniref:20 kDa chaperonin, chloroplastic n=1 Tax=Chlamydomonas euryale TaxID=1486919 RepID=A0A7R9UZ31_9CHLO|mmetsp:Transcript_10145/g.30602  ORF Transcript_10145/g.30602 Transcript_10145/m.30602 type:complete len:244 (+) Transcript_10145:1-732(+)